MAIPGLPGGFSSSSGETHIYFGPGLPGGFRQPGKPSYFPL